MSEIVPHNLCFAGHMMNIELNDDKRKCLNESQGYVNKI
jgi:hypothetical protein